MSTKLTSRLSTLDAARTVFFIVVGLAIKQSLGLFAHTWPSKDFPNAPQWPFGARAIMAAGYLATVIRFSHGVTLLYGHEKERIENSHLPSASKISLLSLFLVLLAVPLFLMADNIVEIDSYIGWTAAMLAADCLYILQSGVVRRPLKRVLRVLKETDRGYAARAAFWWITIDIGLLTVCVSFFVGSGLGRVLAAHPPARELSFAGALLLAAFADYALNWDFYFGGRNDRRKQKFVFVISPLRNGDSEEYKRNINRAQFYCLSLMNWQSRVGKQITPLASHAFFTYFLNDGVAEGRALGLECTLAYISACDAVHVYVPLRTRNFFEKPGVRRVIEERALTKALFDRHDWLVKRVDKAALSPGMRHALDAAKRHGLEIRYIGENLSLPDNWVAPKWTPITYEHRAESKKSGNYFKGAEQRKRVYVCTRFRGADFDDLSWEAKVLVMEGNTKLALWHCHELARDADEAIAPFAPQAFYPYFWPFKKISDNGTCEIDEERRLAWFKRSIEILKVCDAVYIYTAEGVPPTVDDSSYGVLEVDMTARKLGLEIQYRRELPLPDDETARARQVFADAEHTLSELNLQLAAREKELLTLSDTVTELSSKLSDDPSLVADARQQVQLTSARIEGIKLAIETAKLEVAKRDEELKKVTWNPSVPDF